MNIDFILDGKFCDKNKLKSSWLDIKFPGALLPFLKE